MLNSILLILFLIAVSAFFSLSEISLAASRKIKLKLLAEDGDINREIMEVLLEDMGITCISAVNGQEAVDIWNQRSAEVDIILMDVQMPVMDGYSATRAIRASNLPEAKTVPIIAMTAYAMRGDAERSMQEGMDAHLTKPVNLADLRRTLKQFSRGPAE